ncbi:MAG: division/cell wall cluster transcriptional repressor MraZ [Firmicutes bacterium]|nr:division/cell wall cluster transcriptional repressor MraZ [Bacillota bacterium]
MMILGEYFHQIDQKGRMRIPPKLKSALGENITITKGTGGCLFLFDQRTLEDKVLSRVDAVPMSDGASAKPLRILFSSAQELEEDAQGRTLLPRNLREFANIQKDIVFIGVGSRAEIWSREAYDKYMDEADFDTAMEELKRHGV